MGERTGTDLAHADLVLASRHGYWGEHPIHRLADWQDAVVNDDTRQGYWEWVVDQIVALESEPLPPLEMSITDVEANWRKERRDGGAG